MEITRTYRSWYQMRDRCHRTSHHAWKDYGGKGIKVCKEWDSFAQFLLDMGERPEGKTLDRKDGNKDYCKDNCRWATSSEQNLNKTHSGRNTSGRHGVSFRQDRQKYTASGMINGQVIRLYYGPSFEQACKARGLWEVQNGIRIETSNPP